MKLHLRCQINQIHLQELFDTLNGFGQQRWMANSHNPGFPNLLHGSLEHLVGPGVPWSCSLLWHRGCLLWARSEPNSGSSLLFLCYWPYSRRFLHEGSWITGICFPLSRLLVLCQHWNKQNYMELFFPILLDQSNNYKGNPGSFRHSVQLSSRYEIKWEEGSALLCLPFSLFLGLADTFLSWHVFFAPSVVMRTPLACAFHP